MSNVIKEVGKVVAIEGEYVFIETQPRSSCGHCGVGESCGTSALSRFFSQRRSRLRLLNNINLSLGEQVIIGIDESVLLSTAAMAYMLPLVVMILIVIVSDISGFGNGMSFIFSLLGLFLGIIVSNRIMDKRNFKSREITLIRNGSESVIKFLPDKLFKI